MVGTARNRIDGIPVDVAEDSKPSYESEGTFATTQGADPEKIDVDPERQGPPPAYNKERRASRQHESREDPFGDEEGAEVKYRTMSWWYV